MPRNSVFLKSDQIKDSKRYLFLLPHFPAIFPQSMKRFPKPGLVLAFSVGVVILFFLTLPRMGFEYDFTKLQSDMIQYTKEKAIKERFEAGGEKLTPPAIVILNSREDIPAMDQAVEEKIAQDQETPTIRGWLSFYNVWPPKEVQARRMKIIAEIRKLLTDDSMKLLSDADRKKADDILSYTDPEFFPIDAVPEDSRLFFSSRRGDVGIYYYVLSRFDVNTADGRQAIEFAKDAGQWETQRGTFYGSSKDIVFADVLRLMLGKAHYAILISLLIILALVFLDFRKVALTLLVLIPFTLGSLLMLTLLYNMGSKLNFYNIICIPLIVGLGVDDGIHLMHRYLSEGKGSINKVLRTTGKAIFLTSLTDFIAFFGLSCSPHHGLKSMGYLAMAGIFGCFVMSVFALPALLQILEDRKSENSKS